jgi:hypothetical protein
MENVLLGKVLDHILITKILACILNSVVSQEDNSPSLLNDVLTSICNFCVGILKAIRVEAE